MAESWAIITCAVLEDEVRHFLSGNPQVRRLEVLEQGLHNTPEILTARLQATIERIEAETDVDRIGLVYGLCSRGIEGVRTKRATLVIPRGHDCITILLGDRRRYADYVREHPGTYWYSPGWNACTVMPGPERAARLKAEYTERYGLEDADYLMQMEQSWMTHYDRATFVDLGVGDEDQGLAFTRRCADFLGWNVDHQRGDPRLLADLLCGRIDDDRYCVVPPGETVRMTGDDHVIEPTDGSQRTPE